MTLLDLFSLMFFEGSIQAGLTGLLLAGLAMVIRRRNVVLAHSLVGLALIKFAVPPVLPFPTGLFSELDVRFNVQTPAGGPSVMLQLMLALYLGGVMVVGIRRVTELWRLRRIFAEGETSARVEAELERVTRDGEWHSRPAVKVSTAIPVPCTFGVLDPVILIPRILDVRMTDAELRAVLLHEMSHVRRRDAVWNVLSALLGIVWWFHPVFHVVERFARVLREERCDDDVVSGGVPPEEYAHAIVSVAAFQSGRAAAFASAAGGGHPLVKRLESIARTGHGRRPRMRAIGWMLLAVAALVLIPGLSLQSSETPDREFFIHRQTAHGHGH